MKSGLDALKDVFETGSKGHQKYKRCCSRMRDYGRRTQQRHWDSVFNLQTVEL